MYFLNLLAFRKSRTQPLINGPLLFDCSRANGTNGANRANGATYLVDSHTTKQILLGVSRAGRRAEDVERCRYRGEGAGEKRMIPFAKRGCFHFRP